MGRWGALLTETNVKALLSVWPLQASWQRDRPLQNHGIDRGRSSIRAGWTRKKITSSPVKSIKSVLKIRIGINSIANRQKTDTSFPTPVASIPKL